MSACRVFIFAKSADGKDIPYHLLGGAGAGNGDDDADDADDPDDPLDVDLTGGEGFGHGDDGVKGEFVETPP